ALEVLLPGPQPRGGRRAMSEPLRRSPDFGPPSLEALLDEAGDRFEAACQKAGADGTLPRIEDYVADLAGPERVELLQELIPLDMHYRRQRGETPRPEDYRGRFPGLDPQCLADASDGLQTLQRQAEKLHQTGPWPVTSSIPRKREALPETA